VAHCPAELLEDVADLIDEVRGWPDVVERKPGVFYARRLPFLHFHLIEGVRRRADIRGRSGWRSIDLPRPLPATKRRALLRELEKRYRERTTRPSR
jgi:hypothetical protein